MNEAKPLVVLLCYYFPPSSEIGAARPNRFYKYLKSAGYECRVITSTPQDGAAARDIISIPDRLEAIWNGKAPFDRSVRAYAELVFRKWIMPGGTGLAWAFDAAAMCRRVVRESGRPAVLISSFPPDGVQMAALMAARSKGVKWIADFRDPLSFGLGMDLHGAPARRLRRRMESWSMRWSAAVIANTRSMADRWREMLGPNADKVRLIWNGFDPNDRPVALPTTSADAIELAHVGTLYHGRNPNLIMASLDRLRRKGAAKALNTRLVLVGAMESASGTDAELLERAIREGWVRATGELPKKEAQAIAAAAHGQVLLQPGSAVQVPGKLFEYICIGRPIIAVTPRNSDSEYVMQNSGVPYVCLYEDDTEDALDRSLLRYLDLPSDPVPFSPWFEENFELRRQGAQLAALIESVE